MQHYLVHHTLVFYSRCVLDNMMNLLEVSCKLSKRLVWIFEKDELGMRAVFGNRDKFNNDPHFQDYILFHEYFHENTSQGLGANHQMGWTGFVAKLIEQLDDYGHGSSQRHFPRT